MNLYVSVCVSVALRAFTHKCQTITVSIIEIASFIYFIEDLYISPSNYISSDDNTPIKQRIRKNVKDIMAQFKYNPNICLEAE
jgi:hypothetical protein